MHKALLEDNGTRFRSSSCKSAHFNRVGDQNTSRRIMALYKYGNYLTSSTDAAFDAEYKPGDIRPHHGIYRCTGCGHEVVSEAGNKLPPQNHHTHSNGTPIR